MKFEAIINVTHLPGILDPQGAAVQRALPALGYRNVSQVKVGKVIRLVLESSTAKDANIQIIEMCERLLANPVIEAYEIVLRELEPMPTSASA